MPIQVIQGDYTLLRSVETILQADLAALIATANTELDDDSPQLPRFQVTVPADAQLAAREDASLTEQALPQNWYGAWARVVNTEEILGVGSLNGAGQSRMKHRLEVISFIRTNEPERDSVHPTTNTVGYKMCMVLARCVTLALTQNLICTAGVYNIVRVPGARIPSPIKTIQYAHNLRDYFDVWQTVRR